MENDNEIRLPEPDHITQEMTTEALTYTLRGLVQAVIIHNHQIKTLQAAYEDAVNSLKALRGAVDQLPAETINYLLTEMSRRAKAN